MVRNDCIVNGTLNKWNAFQMICLCHYSAVHCQLDKLKEKNKYGKFYLNINQYICISMPHF